MQGLVADGVRLKEAVADVAAATGVRKNALYEAALVSRIPMTGQLGSVNARRRRCRVSLPPLPDPLPHPVVDSHCHLDTAQEVSGLDPAEAIERAAAVGVTKIVQIGCDLAGARFAVEAAERWDSVIAGVAIHPNDAARMRPDELPLALAEIEQLARHPRVRAVGETGLDHYRTRDEAGHRTQRDAFAWHIALAHATGKTLVIHDRDAHADVLDVLDAEGVPERVVMHCFSGDADFARACLDRGAWLSFAGPVTFKPNEHLREALRITPLDRILTETDAPYLTPVPFRGRSNASYLIPHTARFLAETLGPGPDRGLPGAGAERRTTPSAAVGGGLTDGARGGPAAAPDGASLRPVGAGRRRRRSTGSWRPGCGSRRPASPRA